MAENGQTTLERIFGQDFSGECGFETNCFISATVLRPRLCCFYKRKSEQSVGGTRAPDPKKAYLSAILGQGITPGLESFLNFLFLSPGRGRGFVPGTT